MGCIVSLIKKILILALIVAFFALGGWAFLRGKINDYKNPPRAEFIEKETKFADFSGVSGDYQLTRNFNFFGYKKISAKYLPTGQKITILNLKDRCDLTPEDFKTGAIDAKLEYVLANLKDSFITLENFEILQKGNYMAVHRQIPFIVFGADIKNIPFKTVRGTLAVYKNSDSDSIVIFSLTDKNAYNPLIVKNFVEALKF